MDYTPCVPAGTPPANCWVGHLPAPMLGGLAYPPHDRRRLRTCRVQQKPPADFLRLFHTAAVDRFLRTLILYCFYLIQTCEWISFKWRLSAHQIIEPGLKTNQRRQQRNLAALRVLLARDYHALLMGEGAALKFHHMANGVQSWSQRDARLWELLLRMSVRVTYVALRRRYLNLIDAEVGRLFRGEPFNLAARRQQAASAAVGPGAGSEAARHARRAQEVRDEVLYGPADKRFRRLFTRSPATLELLGRPGQEPPRPHWTLLALGRMPVPSLAEGLRRVEAAYTLSEEELVREHCSFIGILGMPRNSLDVMLNIRDKQKRQELLLSTAGWSSGQSGQQCSSLFPAEEDSHTFEPEPDVDSFPFLQD